MVNNKLLNSKLRESIYSSEHDQTDTSKWEDATFKRKLLYILTECKNTEIVL